MYESLDRGHNCIAVTIDLRKAFHKVQRDVLVHKQVKWYEISTGLIDSLIVIDPNSYH
jgi:hypothetical protein